MRSWRSILNTAGPSRTRVITLVVLACGVMSASAGELAAPTNSFSPRLPDFSRYMQGRFVYERNCVVCHGTTGKGDGEMSKELVPKPRSFRSGIFKYRSTPPGKLPTNDDLLRTVRNGVPDTSMPIFDKLSRTDLEAVIEYVKFFSRRWDDPQNYAPPLALPEAPRWMNDSESRRVAASKGGEWYRIACASCHGETGAGDGPASATLTDVWGNPIRPANLRQGNARAGEAPEDLYRLLLTGIEGTPMPAFTDALNDTQRWEVVAYLLEMRNVRSRDTRLENTAQLPATAKGAAQ